MANNELAMRFTETNYATKQEVRKELKMSLIDNIWSNILSYRSYFNRYLAIKSIEKNPLAVCICSSISNSLTSVDSKLNRLNRDYGKLEASNGDLSHFEDRCYALCLKALAKEYQLDVDDIYLRQVIQNEVSNLSGDYRIVSRYAKALKYIKENSQSMINDDFLAEIYSIMTDNQNLTSFYRTEEDKNPENRVLIDRIYTCAPTALIESMMNSLFAFIENGTVPTSVKAIVAYYYICYIKPFPVFSDEIGLLIAKAIMAHYDFGGLSSCLPLETLLSEDQSTIAKIFVEVQKTNDVTYFVNYAIKVLDRATEQVADIHAVLSTEIIKNEFYQEEAPVEETPVAPVEEAIAQAPVPAPGPAPVMQEVKAEPAPQPVVEKPAPKVEVQPKVVYIERPAPAVQEPAKEEIAVGYIPPVLDEKAACRLEEHLLELDPSMKRGEAHFYARHCTLGKRYTIQQYKKSIGCAYETARTSMDHLVAMGYYRKEMVKNKNVYTPISRK